MSNPRKGFLFHGSIYWVGRMLSRSASIVFLPIYTAYISPSEYGLLVVLAMIRNIVSLVLCFQLPTAVYRFWPRQEKKNVLLSSSLLFTFIVSIVILSPLYIWPEPVAQFLDASSYQNLLRLMLFQVQMGMVWLFFQTEMRIHDESKLYAMTDVAQNLLAALFSILLVVYAGLGITGMILSQTLVMLLLICYRAPRFVRRIPIVFDGAVIKKMVLFSAPLIPSAIAMAAVHSADLLFLQKMLGLSATGIYVIGYKFGRLVNLLIGAPFILIWQPRSFEIAETPTAPIQFGAIFTYLAIVLSTAAIMVTGLSHEILQIMVDKDYWDAAIVIPFVAWAYVFFVLVSVVDVGLLVHHKTKCFAMIVMIVFCSNMVGNFFLIPYYGFVGAAIATLISFMLHFALTLYFSYKFLPIKFEIKKLIILLVMGGVLQICMFVVGTGNIFVDVFVKLMMLFCYIIALFAAGFFSKLVVSNYVKKFFNSFSRG